MIKETIRMVADALENGSYGVNEFLTPENRVASFGDETRSDVVAQGMPLEPYPSLNVTLAQPAEFEGEVRTSYRDGFDITIQVSYISKSAKMAEGNAHMWDVMRAVTKTLRRWLSNESAGDRELDGVQVIACTGIEISPPLSVSDDSVIPASLVIRLRIRDIDT